jgi:hypothetical protein
MRSVKKNLIRLKRICKTTKKGRDKILKNADIELIRCLCEIAENTLNNNIHLSNAQYQKLARHKSTLRKLCKRGEGWKKKKSLIRQTGGFLLPLLIPILSLILGKVLN